MPTELVDFLGAESLGEAGRGIEHNRCSVPPQGGGRECKSLDVAGASVMA